MCLRIYVCVMFFNNVDSCYDHIALVMDGMDNGVLLEWYWQAKAEVDLHVIGEDLSQGDFAHHKFHLVCVCVCDMCMHVYI